RRRAAPVRPIAARADPRHHRPSAGRETGSSAPRCPMNRSPAVPERCLLAPGLEISRIVTGLWQIADMERDGTTLDPEVGAAALAEYAASGFDSFDMADH